MSISCVYLQTFSLESAHWSFASEHSRQPSSRAAPEGSVCQLRGGLVCISLSLKFLSACWGEWTREPALPPRPELASKSWLSSSSQDWSFHAKIFLPFCDSWLNMVCNSKLTSWELQRSYPLPSHELLIFGTRCILLGWSKPPDPGAVPKADTGASVFYLIRKCFAPNQTAHSG